MSVISKGCRRFLYQSCLIEMKLKRLRDVLDEIEVLDQRQRERRARTIVASSVLATDGVS